MKCRRGSREVPDRDEGSALILTLILILVCSLLVLPIMDYAMGVSRSSRVVQTKSVHVEAVKGGLRTALADPVNLYKVCSAAGLTVAVPLASPSLSTPVSSRCYKLDQAVANDPANLRYGVATLQVGSSPPSALAGTVYSGSGAAPETAWLAEKTDVSSANKIWLPLLPAHALNRRPAAGYSMPSGFTPCTVYFPGTYVDDVVITGSTPVYFASGIYYFEKTLRVSGSASVVVGAGAIEGCSTDQEAAFNATSAPSNHHIGGLGATFVFGDRGRLLLDTATPGSGVSLVFNQRYVAPEDISAAPSAGVSIETVNGVLTGTTGSDLSILGVIHVPLSQVGGTTPTSAIAQEYKPSVFIPTASPSPGPGPTTTIAATTTTTAPPPAQTPVVEINLTTSTPVTLVVPGYTSVPQGLVKVTTSAGAEVSKDIRVTGGVLAGSIEVSGPMPVSFNLGLVNPVVQQTFKIVSETTSGLPKAISTAIVQVNENGAYAVNSWEVQ